jgi:hypothetical protein
MKYLSCMKTDYWNVTEEQVVEKTGKGLAHWRRVLDAFGVAGKSNDVVEHLQKAHGVPRYWARTLTTWYLKQPQK